MAETVNDRIQDQVVKRQTDVLRLAETQAREAIKTVNSSEEETIAAITLALLAITNAPTRANFERLAELQRRIERIRSRAFEAARENNAAQMEEVAESESQWAVLMALALAGLTLTGLTREVIRDLITIVPFAGRTPEQWWESVFRSDVQRIMTAIRIGVRNGLTAKEIIDNIRGKRGVAGAMDTTRDDIRAVTRTIATGVSDAAQTQTIKKSIEFDRVQWVSVLDSRTSTICRGLSGMVWKIDEPHPEPPAHTSCRSSLTYLIAGVAKAQDMTYEQWLSRQPVEFQREILPKWQYRAWKDGAPLKTFVTKDIEPLTMKEFKRRVES